MNDFEGFYLSCKDGVFRTVLAVSGNRTGAEDAVAEAFARACARWDAVRQHPDPRAWVIRTALNWQRSWWRNTRREILGSVPDRPLPESPAESLQHLVRSLPRRQREVVALRLLADLSAEQTGDILGIAVGTVHAHLHRAIATLRELTAREEVSS